MKRAGIRQARQNLSALLDDVRRGHEVVLVDRGRPVARLVPLAPAKARPFPNLARFRREMPTITPPVSQAIVEEREDRL